jgi:hypothetical protein
MFLCITVLQFNTRTIEQSIYYFLTWSLKVYPAMQFTFKTSSKLAQGEGFENVNYSELGINEC